MFKAFKISLLLLIPVIGMALLPLCGCDKIKEAIATSEIDFGTITNSVYQNNYFGFSVTFPQDWSIQDQTEQRQLMVKGSHALYGDSSKGQAVLNAAALQVVNLFAVSQYPMGSHVEFNSSILSMAERVRQAPDVKTGTDYLEHVKTQLASGRLAISYPGDIYTTQVGGKDFSVMELEMTTPKMTVRQKYYAAIMKGYALGFILSYSSDEQESSLQKILDTVTFK